MQAPGKPPDEAARLEALASYRILDTAFEAGFDGLTKLAAHLLEVPIALISILDADRQWFKSRYGLESPETTREVSFCGHVVQDGALLLVPDAAADARFADNPLVTGDPHIRFYAGTPLRTAEGHVLGTLCAIDRQPRQVSARQLELLRLLADQVMDQLELRRQRHTLILERASLLASQRELAAGEARLRALFDGMAEGVVLQDSSGAIKACNLAAERILGLDLAQLLGRSLVDPRWKATRLDGAPFPGDEHPAMVTQRTGLPCSDVGMHVYRPSGERATIRVNSQPLQPGPDGLPGSVVCTFRDTTEVERLREHLTRQQRLVTTGTLAAGVGHEINNPLAFVSTNLDFALEELHSLCGASPSARQRELIGALSEAREGAERIRKIVRGLRTLAREEEPRVAVAVHPALETAAAMAMHEVRHRARLELLLEPVPPVLADEAGLSQVFVNLIVNAAQCFAGGSPERNRIVVRTRLEGASVVIEVEDNGPGIAPEVLPRIFDPFFTTKPVGVGTGLGLSISHSVVTGLSGELSCVTEPGAGTRFRVVLPAAPGPAAEEQGVAAGRAGGRRGRVLLVDDEEGMLSTSARVLRADHEVVTLSDPREALRRLLSAEERFDVVFCDLVMPYLTGVDLYRLATAQDPSLAGRFVFLIGGAIREELRGALEQLPNQRLDKPFSAQDLRELARGFVEAGAAPTR